ncbi:hypothetical protein HDK77DRAFT_136856 [Phyllosticta capitalensis]
MYLGTRAEKILVGNASMSTESTPKPTAHQGLSFLACQNKGRDKQTDVAHITTAPRTVLRQARAPRVALRDTLQVKLHTTSIFYARTLGHVAALACAWLSLFACHFHPLRRRQGKRRAEPDLIAATAAWWLHLDRSSQQGIRRAASRWWHGEIRGSGLGVETWRFLSRGTARRPLSCLALHVSFPPTGLDHDGFMRGRLNDGIARGYCEMDGL